MAKWTGTEDKDWIDRKKQWDKRTKRTRERSKSTGLTYREKMNQSRKASIRNLKGSGAIVGV